MSVWKRFAGGVAFTALTAAMAQTGFAQETTSGVHGTVNLASGAPAPGPRSR